MNAGEGAGRRYMARRLVMSAGMSAGSVLLITLYLSALLRITPAQWQGFAWLVGVFFVVLFVAQSAVQRRYWAPLVHCIDRRTAGDATPDDLRQGFRAISRLPLMSFNWGWFWWVLGGVVVGGGMRLLYGDFSAFSALTMVLGALGGGFLMSVAHYFVMKRMLAGERQSLARAIGDPAERGALVTSVRLSAKLLVTITGLTIVISVFAMLLSNVQSARPVESHAARLQGNLLGAVAANWPERGDVNLAPTLKRAREFGISDGIGVLDADFTHVVSGDLSALAASERAAMRALGVDVGTSEAFESPHVIAWRRLPDGRWLVSYADWAPLRGDLSGNHMVFGVFMLLTVLLALVVARLLSDDVSRAVSVLRGEAERMASGDLSRGRVFESEDELGELARSFELMGSSLRATVSRVAEAADRVEATAGELSPVSRGVAEVSADQVSGIEQATSSMEEINAQVRGIAGGAAALNESTEEASSSILELGASSEELNDTASLLSSKVEEVSSSIEQMVRSVTQVSENTEGLAGAAEETSASMEEMASSLREVDASAAEAARLSAQVVSSAESGQAKVRQTIEGMDAIREVTETAEVVIRSLHGRTVEIGAIVDVIDDVADETNLLALNAAIIAAQAGDHGRAFSVVADEIKDLAERVLASTKEIGSLIGSVQEEARRATSAIERGSESVASGVDLSAEAGMALEEITQASRESGSRITGIVTSMREQAKAAVHVVELMETVRRGVDEIRSASAEQDRGNVVVYEGSLTMREVAQQVRGTTEEQSRGSGRIRESVEGVREAVEQIDAALQEQSQACAAAAEFLEAVRARTRSNDEATRTLDAVTRELLVQAEALRDEVGRFRV